MIALLHLPLLVAAVSLATAQPVPPTSLKGIGRLVDDFESYEQGDLPTRWKYFHDNALVDVSERFVSDRESFRVGREKGNQYLRFFTKGEAQHLTMPFNEGEGTPPWDLTTHPRLTWDWRATKLPPGAREDQKRLNDTGAGLYVIFAIDGLIVKRPRTIKYTYSSTLPVGTVVDYGKLKVIVASTARDGYGGWEHVERDVVADYRRVFGGEPPDEPLSIRLWADSDDTGAEAEADFDNITILPAR